MDAHDSRQDYGTPEEIMAWVMAKPVNRRVRVRCGSCYAQDLETCAHQPDRVRCGYCYARGEQHCPHAGALTGG
jgi:hypothetical protein